MLGQLDLPFLGDLLEHSQSVLWYMDRNAIVEVYTLVLPAVVVECGRLNLMHWQCLSRKYAIKIVHPAFIHISQKKDAYFIEIPPYHM